LKNNINFMINMNPADAAALANTSGFLMNQGFEAAEQRVYDILTDSVGFGFNSDTQKMWIITGVCLATVSAGLGTGAYSARNKPSKLGSMVGFSFISLMLFMFTYSRIRSWKYTNTLSEITSQPLRKVYAITMASFLGHVVIEGFLIGREAKKDDTERKLGRASAWSAARLWLTFCIALTVNDSYENSAQIELWNKYGDAFAGCISTDAKCVPTGSANVDKYLKIIREYLKDSTNPTESAMSGLKSIYGMGRPMIQIDGFTKYIAMRQHYDTLSIINTFFKRLITPILIVIAVVMRIGKGIKPAQGVNRRR
jgi:hypothetical protein